MDTQGSTSKQDTVRLCVPSPWTVVTNEEDRIAVEFAPFCVGCPREKSYGFDATRWTARRTWRSWIGMDPLAGRTFSIHQTWIEKISSQLSQSLKYWATIVCVENSDPSRLYEPLPPTTRPLRSLLSLVQILHRKEQHSNKENLKKCELDYVNLEYTTPSYVDSIDIGNHTLAQIMAKYSAIFLHTLGH
ncbi:unnamed protein product [Xylocopa violacea]|uniref:Uncharacterized protein n=1 Tax=Xylocopa violacea TaxID=135666 RepID=A0ABP1NGU0_XYLVO